MTYKPKTFNQSWRLKDDDKSTTDADIKKELIDGKKALDRLKRICYNKQLAKSNFARSIDRFDEANWELRQAHAYGYHAALQELIKLIEDK